MLSFLDEMFYRNVSNRQTALVINAPDKQHKKKYLGVRLEGCWIQHSIDMIKQNAKTTC